MESNIYQLEITTPQQKYAFKNVTSCTVPGKNGSFQILYNHAPIMSELEIGLVKVEDGGILKQFATSGGFLEASDNQVSLLLETCEEALKIDVERANKSVERAKKRLKERLEGLDWERAEISLARAINRIKVAKK